MKNANTSSQLAVLLMLSSGAATAHHGPGQFDSSQPVEVTGVVTELRLVNPHAYVYFNVTEADGTVVPWRCELQAGSLLRRSGWTVDLFKPGDTITVTGDQGTREAHACALRSVVLADGRVLSRYDNLIDTTQQPARPPRLADGQLNLAGTWAAPLRNPGGGTGGRGPRPGGIGPGPGGPGGPRGPGGGGGPAIRPTAAGLAAVEGLNHQADNPRFHCMAVNIFFDWEFDRHVNEIEQTPTTITLKYGFMDIVRTIHMDLAEHPSNIVPSRAGHSIGHWEDDVLVVDTVGFEEGFIVAGPRGLIKHSDGLHAVERFSYDPATKGLTRSYVAEDPLYFEGQYTGQDTVFATDAAFVPYDCVELKDAALPD